MKVSDILRAKASGSTLYTTTPEDRLADAAALMAEHDIGSLVVIAHGRVVGMLTFREVIRAVVKNGGSIGDATVWKAMDNGPLICTLETELEFPRPDPTNAFREVLGDIERLEATIAELLHLARTNDRPAAIELGPVLAQLSRAWVPRAEAQGRNLHVEGGRYAPAAIGHATMLRHALDVLVDNALVHGRGDITVTIATDDNTVTLTVHDHGPGIATPVDEIAHTAAPPARTGRGLPLARRLVAAQHGRLDVLPPPGGHVAIRLRRADPAAPPETA